MTDTSLSGMTGFARTSAHFDIYAWTWEVRSVNGKGLEVRARLPQGFDRLDNPLRALLKTVFSRGSFQATLTLQTETGEGRYRINIDQLRAYAEAGQVLVDEGLALTPNLDGLLALKGVIIADDGEASEELESEALDQHILASLAEALKALKEARETEGRALSPVLLGHIDEIESLTARAETHTAGQSERLRDRVQAKFDELLTKGLDQDRLAVEAAALAVKADVREEIDRLKAHIASARDLLAKGSPIGRKLDFLSQEFNREANTLCSKSADIGLTDIGLALKATIDQFREQIQNVE
ncbi:YicC/YloC family endoribonuclease [Woodsholea maritima]|uniref:YicC/YloC family endoribonuclease n=1 Tax=Woodsholea maritima TaxID=240237 RepID=UPI00036BB8C9|nr:YicC/YloC family endoribonuclease [Woodsholea maritima]